MALLNRPAGVLVAGAIVLGWSVTAAILGAPRSPFLASSEASPTVRL